VDVLERNPSQVLCCTSIKFIDETSCPLSVVYNTFDNPDLSDDGVHKRVGGLAACHGWYAIYGLIRSDALKKTGLFRVIYGPDVVLLMELCLIGPFSKVPEVLFYYRQYHNKTEKDRASHMDPTIHPEPVYSDLVCNLVRTVMASELHLLFKIIVVVELLSVIYFHNSSLMTQIRNENANKMLYLFRKMEFRDIIKRAPLFALFNLPRLIRFRISR
jgi:hypothetical protein